MVDNRASYLSEKGKGKKRRKKNKQNTGVIALAFHSDAVEKIRANKNP